MRMWLFSRNAVPVYVFLAALLSVGFHYWDISADDGSDAVQTQSAGPSANDGFVRASGRLLVRNGGPFLLKAVGFSNYYNYKLYENGFDLLVSDHHGERDFERARDIGFNSIRFAFNANWYIEDADAFWTWLDRNIGWAERTGIMLILDMHVPIGGFWLAPKSPDAEFRIWSDPHIRQQNIELWRAIAERYRDNHAIAAYDILNEPVTDDETGNQWRSLARDLVTAIRQVDQNHLLIVGHLYGTNRTYGTDGIDSQFLVDDDNVMYDFHFYEPIVFTHQFATWVDRPMGDGGVYPDPDTPIPTGIQVLVPSSRVNSERLSAGDSAWREHKSEAVAIEDQGLVAGLPLMTLRGEVSGSVLFDDIKVLEYDHDGALIGELVREPVTWESGWKWWSWSSSNSASGVVDDSIEFRRSDTDGANDAYSLGIAKAGPSDMLVGWSSDSHWFKVTPGNSYQIVGNMKGAGIDYAGAEDAGFVGFELDFYRAPEDAGGKAFLFRNGAYLEHEFLKLYRFGIENDVPMSVMEFGTTRMTFEDPKKGGTEWVGDLLDIFRDHDVSFSYWNYHDELMGLYLNDQHSPPVIPNEALITVLRAKLAAWDAADPQ